MQMQFPTMTYGQFLETIPDATLVVDRAGKIVLANSQAYVLFGYHPGELQDQSIQTLVPETKREAHAKHMEGFFVSPKTRPLGTRRKLSARRKDGSEFPTDILLSPVEMGGALLTVCIVLDITELARMEAALRQSEEKYRLLVENSSEVFYQVSLRDDPLRGQVEFVSQQAEIITGHSAAEFVQDPELWSRSVHPDDIGGVAGATKGILASRTHGTREYRVWHSRQREYRWMEDRVVPRFDLEGNVTGYQGAARDITKRKQAEQSLVLFRTLIDRSNDAVEVIDPETAHFIDVNEKSCRDLGYTRQEYLSLTVFDIDPAVNRSSYGTVIERLRSVGSLLWEGFHRRKDGSTFPVEVSLRYVQLDRDYVVTVARDITERKRAEEALAQANEQLHALAAYLHTSIEAERTHIAREIHDDFGQSMTALKMDLDWLANRLPEGDARRQRLGGMNTLVDDSISLMRRIASSLRPILLDDLGLVAALEWQIAGFSKRTGIVCELSLPPDLKLAPALNTTLYRIFQETLTNVGRHAQATRVVAGLQQEGQTMILTVVDDGRGIMESEIKDPHSLGLLGLRERAVQWGGGLTIVGAPGEGTTVTVQIPLPASPATGEDQ